MSKILDWFKNSMRSLHKKCPHCKNGRMFVVEYDPEINSMIYECDCCGRESLGVK